MYWASMAGVLGTMGTAGIVIPAWSVPLPQAPEMEMPESSVTPAEALIVDLPPAHWMVPMPALNVVPPRSWLNLRPAETWSPLPIETAAEIGPRSALS